MSSMVKLSRIKISVFYRLKRRKSIFLFLTIWPLCSSHRIIIYDNICYYIPMNLGWCIFSWYFASCKRITNSFCLNSVAMHDQAWMIQNVSCFEFERWNPSKKRQMATFLSSLFISSLSHKTLPTICRIYSNV